MTITYRQARDAAISSLASFEQFGTPMPDRTFANASWFLVGYAFPGYESGVEGLPVVLVDRESGEAVHMWPSDPHDRELYSARTAGMTEYRDPQAVSA